MFKIGCKKDLISLFQFRVSRSPGTPCCASHAAVAAAALLAGAAEAPVAAAAASGSTRSPAFTAPATEKKAKYLYQI